MKINWIDVIKIVGIPIALVAAGVATGVAAEAGVRVGEALVAAGVAGLLIVIIALSKDDDSNQARREK